jgi:hypothetical protein
MNYLRPVLVLSVWLLIGNSAATAAAGSELDRLSRTQLNALQAADEQTLLRCRSGLSNVLAFAAGQSRIFPDQKVALDFLDRTEREAAVETWKSLLDYMAALDGVCQQHMRFYALKLNSAERRRSFWIAYGAFVARYRCALEFLRRAENNPALDQLFNDPVLELGLAKNGYNRFKLFFLNSGRGIEFAALSALGAGRQNGDSRLQSVVNEDSNYIWKQGQGPGERMTAKNALKAIGNAGVAAWFPVQKNVSEWMGDTRVSWREKSLITEEQIRTLPQKLFPGDVLLIRHEWYLSNIGLPGFWPHAALYAGTPAERDAFFNDGETKVWLASLNPPCSTLDEYLRREFPIAYQHGIELHREGEPRILEAISEGVSFTALAHALEADSMVALRPRLSRLDKAKALARAFGYEGRPYDFDFNFQTDSALVCTELVYKSYEPAGGMNGLRLPLKEMLGRKVMPANEIARLFDEESREGHPQFDFVTFLDGREYSVKAVESSVEEFRASWKRPKWHLMTNTVAEAVSKEGAK